MTSTLAQKDDVQKLWQEYKSNPNEKLRNELVERYLSIVNYQAQRIWNRLPDGVELDDLISTGVFGLIDAIKAFDLARGIKFETYCVTRICGAMLDGLRANDWVPRLVRSKATKISEAAQQFEIENGRSPTDSELAEHMSLSLHELNRYRFEATAVNQTSLDKKRFESDSFKEVGEIDILDDKKGEDPTRRTQKHDLMRLVTKGLNRNERLIVILYYYEELTLKEIGESLGVSESRVSQMHSAIVERLKSQLGKRLPEFAA